MGRDAEGLRGDGLLLSFLSFNEKIMIFLSRSNDGGGREKTARGWECLLPTGSREAGI